MLRKTLAILSLIGLVLSLWLWAVSLWVTIMYDGQGWAAGISKWMIGFELSGNSRGFVFEYGDIRGPYSWLPVYEQGIVVPLWIISFICFLGLIWATIVTRRRRHQLGLCTQCDYNLTGLTTSRCPECGAEFDPQLIKTPIDQ